MKIRFYNRDQQTNTLTDAANVIFSDEGGNFGIKRLDTNEIVLPSGTALTKFATGSYEYDFIPNPLTSYRYAITWTYENITKSIENVFLSTATSSIYPTYISLSDAENYFSSRLHSSAWHDATGDDKVASLITASRLLSSLNFKYYKTAVDQPLEFPRNAELIIPEAIAHACAEIAISLLDGNDPETNYRNLRVSSRRYAGVGSTYDTKHTPDHILVGIPSFIAWNLLQPYLAELGSIRLHRVS